VSDDHRSRGGFPEAPVHPLSAFVTIVLDWIWTAVELPLAASIVGMPAIIPISLSIGALCCLATTLVQKFVSHDSWGAALAKGLVLGIAAGVPYPVTGTAVGAPLLLWSGLHAVQRLLLKSPHE
jgi:hypothetical protein